MALVPSLSLPFQLHLLFAYTVYTWLVHRFQPFFVHVLDRCHLSVGGTCWNLLIVSVSSHFFVFRPPGVRWVCPHSGRTCSVSSHFFVYWSLNAAKLKSWSNRSGREHDYVVRTAVKSLPAGCPWKATVPKPAFEPQPEPIRTPTGTNSSCA